ncbi:MAG: hypothetical protein COS37_07820 [Anaerolineae bacterium CG03_land_8_20_14_0_80_58_20]|nr:MAG: hypothetical protein AUJ21_08265 [Anaerolineae bacterium CG1_02_58_13]PIV26159.1 MAG: hypothetical protein COS37_07820 [Anaerolineae bacterium CG03_land_8_20_14_0_80_58_20]
MGIVLQKSFFHRPDSAVTAKPSAKQSPRQSGDCFGKNALAMTAAKRMRKEFIWRGIITEDDPAVKVA